MSSNHDIHKHPPNNEIIKYISEQPGIFRFHIFETRGIDWPTDFIYIPYNQESLYGEEGTWLVEYMNIFLSFALGEMPKFWGVLNVKYITSTEPLKISGFKFVKKFNKCKKYCPSIKEQLRAFGPYLYENEKFLPRAYVVRAHV